MSTSRRFHRVAVIGAGMAGAACAAALHQAGLSVTVFDKSRGIGGRMATRRAEWQGVDGSVVMAEFDHGAQHFAARQPRFRAAMRRAAAAGVVAAWRPHVHAAWPTPRERETFVPVRQMSALCSHLLKDVPVQLQHQIQRLQRSAAGWQVVAVDGSVSGPFDQVLLAMPPAQAAVLLAGHQDRWADELAAIRMESCWTLMAATQELDWPWDAAEPSQGPLSWVVRNDRKPGRLVPPGVATWVAHASPAWSAAHQDAQSEAVIQALKPALAALLPTGVPLQWLHVAAQRWRYALPAVAGTHSADCRWDVELGLGVCGDFMGRGDSPGVEAAWRSGDELADTLLAALDDETASPLPLPAQAPVRAPARLLAHAAA